MPLFRQHRVDVIWYALDQGDQESRGRGGAGFRTLRDEGEFAGLVDRHIEIELAFGGAYFGNVDVELVDRVGLELALRLLVTCYLGQPADSMALQAAMQG